MRISGGQRKKLVAGDAEDFDYFGWSVAISGETIVVGAPYEDAGALNVVDVGTAYVFERHKNGSDQWGQDFILAAGDRQASDLFGISVSINEDTIAVGAHAEDGGPGDPLTEAGAAYVYDRDHGGIGGWGLTKKLQAGDRQAGDTFGFSVAIDGYMILVGARSEDGGAGYPDADGGAAYVFHRDQGGSGNWGEYDKVLPQFGAKSGDYFGQSVALSDTLLVVGAPYRDGGFTIPPSSNVGAAYVFSLPPGLTLYLPIVIRSP